MRVLLSLNEEVHDIFTGKLPEKVYMGSLQLVDAFQRQGHEVRIVHPTKLDYGDVPRFQNFMVYTDGKLQTHEVTQDMEADLFFVRSLGEDAVTPQKSQDFLQSLYDIEEFMPVLNTPQSTQYEIKSKQKTLDLPFIPSVEPTSINDLEEILSGGQALIAKPDVGFHRKGIRFLNDPKQAKFFEENIDNYVFEKFMPEQVERRYLFLEEELLFVREIRLAGSPGREDEIDRKLLYETDLQELTIAQDAIKKAGMFYGSVDFRQNYILEINGSGTGTGGFQTYSGEEVYDLIVSAVERRL